MAAPAAPTHRWLYGPARDLLIGCGLWYAFALLVMAGPGDAIRLPPPSVSTKIDWEVEIGVVIGRPAYRVSQADAMDHVFGYVNFIDGSARGLPPSNNTFFQMKSRETFAPIGPYLVTADEIADPHRLQVRLMVNGVIKQDFNTSDMAQE